MSASSKSDLAKCLSSLGHNIESFGVSLVTVTTHIKIVLAQMKS